MTNPGSGTTGFMDPTGKDALTISVIPNPGEALSNDQIANKFEMTLQAGSQFTGFQNETINPTIMLAGESWSQRAFTATNTQSGSKGRLIIIADNHPKQSASTMAYIIAYGGPLTNFDQVNMSDFQLMLQSFKFTS